MAPHSLFSPALVLLFVVGCGGNSSSPTYGPSNPDTGNGSPTDTGTTTHAVRVGPGSTFSPATLTIRPGDTVTWTWDEGGHSVTSGVAGVADDQFCSPSDASCSAGTLSGTGTSYTHTFPTAGSFPYFCAAHFSMGMTGTITVGQ